MSYKRAFQTAASTVDSALQEAYAKEDAPKNNDEYILYRDTLFRENPQLLRDFVAQSIGSRNPEAIESGVKRYYQEMGG